MNVAKIDDKSSISFGCLGLTINYYRIIFCGFSEFKFNSKSNLYNIASKKKNSNVLLNDDYCDWYIMSNCISKRCFLFILKKNKPIKTIKYDIFLHFKWTEGKNRSTMMNHCQHDTISMKSIAFWSSTCSLKSNASKMVSIFVVQPKKKKKTNCLLKDQKKFQYKSKNIRRLKTSLRLMTS